MYDIADLKFNLRIKDLIIRLFRQKRTSKLLSVYDLSLYICVFRIWLLYFSFSPLYLSSHARSLVNIENYRVSSCPLNRIISLSLSIDNLSLFLSCTSKFDTRHLILNANERTSQSFSKKKKKK